MKKILGILGLIFLAGVFMSAQSKAKEPSGQKETIILAGGCFWCIESDFDKLPGVLSTVSGYTGGKLENPTYKQVSRGGTGHYEAVKIVFDPKQVNTATLLDYFWRHIDPLDDKGQFCDRGDQYRAAVFVDGKKQKSETLASKKRAEEALGKKIVTEILPAAPFYDAEEYHQDYYTKSPTRYKFYRYKCGRDARVRKVWE